MKVVRLSALRTGRLYPRKSSWYSFLLEAESTPGPYCGRYDYVNAKFQWHHRGIKLVTFRLTMQCPNYLRHRVPLFTNKCTKACSSKPLTIQFTLILLTWNIGWAPNNASKWQMKFNSAFKGLLRKLIASFMLFLLWIVILSYNVGRRNALLFNLFQFFPLSPTSTFRTPGLILYGCETWSLILGLSQPIT
jgi:hypothetical protein